MTAPPASAASRSTRRRRASRPTGEQREHAIVATLHQLLATRALHAISVDDLAAGAGISRPTFYFYFASKEAVLVALLEQLATEVEQATRAVAPRLAATPRAAWHGAIDATFAVWTANQGVLRAAAEARAGDPEVAALWDRVLTFFVATTTEAIEAERARGAAPTGVPAGELAIVLNRMNERVFETTLAAEPNALDADGVVDTLTEVWLRAIYDTSPRR